MGFIDQFKRSLGMEEEKRMSMKPFVEEILESNTNVSITPEQPFYEIILIKPRTEDDLDYVRDQIIEGNPVVIDVAYLEKEGDETFEMIGAKLNVLRKEHKAEAILLCKTKDKHIILISPNKIKVIKKG